MPGKSCVLVFSANFSGGGGGGGVMLLANTGAPEAKHEQHV